MKRLEAAAVIVDVGGRGRTVVDDVDDVLLAIEALGRAGLVVILVPEGTSLRLKSRRRRWRQRREER